MRSPSPHPKPWRLALVIVAVGVPGILSLLLVLPDIQGVPRAALLLNPTAMLVVFAFAGSFLAPRCGLGSRIADHVGGSGSAWASPRDFTAIGVGIGLGIAIALADQALAPFWQLRPVFPPSVMEAWSPIGFLTGALYGGLVEEITMRWGAMSVLVWTIWRSLARQSPRPPQFALLAGIVIAALIFAVGHLPVLTASGVELTSAILARTIGFNVVAGLIFGWFFATRDLESAMLCHVGFHIGAAIAAMGSAHIG